MQTAKANAVIETHRFERLEGSVSDDGRASVRIDLLSVKSGIDVRDVRMRFLLFKTYKFPFATITATIDQARLQGLAQSTRLPYELDVTVDMHGVTKDLRVPVSVTRLGDKAVAVTTVAPVIVSAETFGLQEGVAKLSEAVGGTPIVSAASFTFDLVFETGERTARLQLATAEAAAVRAKEESAPITPEACQTRFGVISTASAIYFRTASSELDRASDPILDSVADIANRCASVKVEVTGHTDSVGSKAANAQLSEQRANAVVSYLVAKGVRPQRIDSAGFGDARPVASNDTEANRAKNRRIEFRVK